MDAMSGATVTVMVMDDTIIRSGIKVARAYGLGGLKPEKAQTGPAYRLNTELNEVQDWISLISDGSVRRLKISLDNVNKAFEATNNIPAIDRAEQGDPSDTFIELYAGLVSVPSIGRSMLGEAEYKNMMNDEKKGLEDTQKNIETMKGQIDKEKQADEAAKLTKLDNLNKKLTNQVDSTNRKVENANTKIKELTAEIAKQSVDLAGASCRDACECQLNGICEAHWVVRPVS